MIGSWMTPNEEARAVRASAARARCSVRSQRLQDTASGPRVASQVACPDGWAAARMLVALSSEDAKTAGARDLALMLRQEAPGDEAFARRVHQYVLDNVRFVREPGEVFTAASYTLDLGAGDCDDHARVVYALLRAGGLPARLAFLYRKGDNGPSHVVAQAAVNGQWNWLETTIPAHFNEHPFAAGTRLGLLGKRNDIAREVAVMSDRDLPSLPPDFDEHNPPELVATDVAALQRLGFLCGASPTSASDPVFRDAVLAFQRVHGGLAEDGAIGPKTRAALGEIGDATTTATSQTAHLSSGFFRGVADMARRFNAAGAKLKGENFLTVWLSESGLKNVQNAAGYPAYGLNQLFNSAAVPGFKNVGWTGTPQEYLALTPEQQLPYIEKYYRVATGGNLSLLQGDTSLYLVNFLPAYIKHANDPTFVLASKANDPNGIYKANAGFDVDNKGTIVVYDLKAKMASDQRNAGSYWTEVRNRYYAESGDSGTGDDSPTSPNIAGAAVAVLLLAGIVAGASSIT